MGSLAIRALYEWSGCPLGPILISHSLAPSLSLSLSMITYVYEILIRIHTKIYIYNAHIYGLEPTHCPVVSEWNMTKSAS